MKAKFHGYTRKHFRWRAQCDKRQKIKTTYNQLQKYLRHCTVFWHKWPVHDLVFVIPPPPLIKVASNTRPCSKLGGTTLNGWEEGGQYYISQTCDQEHLKQERSFFRGSVSTFLQLVVALMWSYDKTRSKLCYITKKTWHEKGNAWQNNTCTCRRKHLSLYGQYIIGLVPNILCLFAVTLYKAIPLLHGHTYCWSQWRLQRKLFRFTKGQVVTLK